MIKVFCIICGKQFEYKGKIKFADYCIECRPIVSKLKGVWAGMITRCNNPHFPKYKYYGARGIRVCDRWRTL